MKNIRTPLIKPRNNGGTFYTFGSALEDIGLNINELSDKIALSHYVLLDLPETSNIQGDNFNIAFAESLQNYALNFETVVRNEDNYNFSEKLTVSERIFWQWLFKNYGSESSIESTSYVGYAYTTSEHQENGIIKGFGAITAGSQRTDSYGIYNETYVQIPSSYGTMPVLFKSVNDYNYKSNNEYEPTTINKIENIDDSEISNDTIIATGLSSVPKFDNNNKYVVDSSAGNLCVEFSLDNLRRCYGDDNLTYDDLATKQDYSKSSNYKFNAILIYYSIYNNNGDILATNLYGILILNNALNNETKFPEIEKKASNFGVIGNSYAFRLNIKPTSVYSTDITVNDNSTSGYELTPAFNDIIRNLAVTVDVLKSNSNTISVLISQNTALKEMLIQALDKIDLLEQTINGEGGILARLTALENQLIN